MQAFFFFLAMSICRPVISSGPMIKAPDFVQAPVEKKKKDTASLNGRWYLQPLLAADTAAGKFPSLQINVAGSSFTGNTGCNTMRGRFQKTDSSLVFDQNLVTTKMTCTGYNESAFIRTLLRTNRYKIQNGVLILLFDGTELSRWTRSPDRKIKIKSA